MAMDNKSFNAILRMFDTHVNLLEVLHGKPALATVTLFSGGFFTGAPQARDHSQLLGMRSKGEGVAAAPLLLHFRATGEGYNLVIKNPGDHYNKVIDKRWLEIFGVKDPSTHNPTTFTLLNIENRAITRKDINTTHVPVSLMTNNNKYVGGFKVRGSSYRYLAETQEKSKITFILTLV